MSMPRPYYDPANPDPWYALSLDESTFFATGAKEALLRNNDTRSREVLLPVIRPFARLSIAMVKIIRIFIPNRFTSSKALHYLVAFGMKNFLSRDANYLIIRHFHIGSQILRFLNDNLADGTLPSVPLRPKRIEDFKDHLFVQHDLNIYNFIIELNAYLKENGKTIIPADASKIDFSAIYDFDHEIESIPDT